MKNKTIKAEDIKPGMMVRVISRITTGVDAVSPYDKDHIEIKLKDASMIVGKDDLLWVIE